MTNEFNPILGIFVPVLGIIVYLYIWWYLPKKKKTRCDRINDEVRKQNEEMNHLRLEMIREAHKNRTGNLDTTCNYCGASPIILVHDVGVCPQCGISMSIEAWSMYANNRVRVV